MLIDEDGMRGHIDGMRRGCGGQKSQRGGAFAGRTPLCELTDAMVQCMTDNYIIDCT